MKKLIFSFVALALFPPFCAAQQGKNRSAAPAAKTAADSGGIVVVSDNNGVSDSTAAAAGRAPAKAAAPETGNGEPWQDGVGVIPDAVSDEPDVSGGGDGAGMEEADGGSDESVQGERQFPPFITLDQAVPSAFGALKGVAPSGAGAALLFFEDGAGTVRVLQIKGIGTAKVSLEPGVEIQRSGQ
ncbi:MAG: hypothetical protein PHP45_02810 [Elusimicrobiales bacterium]|nr:hypothetical protein [Elusimicrobiales bacterium]